MTSTILSTALTTIGAAQTVVNGGSPNGVAGWNIFDDNRAAASFSTAGPIAFDAIRFWGILPQSAPFTGNIFWEILHDNGGAPGSVVAAGNSVATSTLRTELTPGVFSWQFDLALAAQQSLGTGVFWLALHDGPVDYSLTDPAGFTGSSLLWEATDAPGQYDVQTFSIDQSWNPGGAQSLAFELRSTEPVVATPEPASVTMLATGLVGIAGARFRVRRRKVNDV